MLFCLIWHGHALMVWVCVCLCVFCLNSDAYSLTPADFGVLLWFTQGVRPLLPLPEGLHRPVDGLLLSLAGRHRRQLAGVLHHSLHWGSFCRTDLHHLHLRGTGETDPPGCSLPHQQKQQLTETNAVLVSTLFIYSTHEYIYSTWIHCYLYTNDNCLNIFPFTFFYLCRWTLYNEIFLER